MMTAVGAVLVRAGAGGVSDRPHTGGGGPAWNIGNIRAAGGTVLRPQALMGS